MYKKFSFEVDQSDLPPQDVSQPKYFGLHLLPAADSALSSICSLHDVKVCLHFLSYTCNEIIFDVVDVKPIRTWIHLLYY